MSTDAGSTIEIRMLGPDDGAVLANAAPDVFDNPLDARWTSEFLADDRHHIAVAIDAGRVIGMASAVHYVHPDKAPELWINEVGVAPSHQGRGIGRRLLHSVLERGRELGCTSAWVGADQSNAPAHRLYEAVGGRPAPEPFIMFEFALASGEG